MTATKGHDVDAYSRGGALYSDAPLDVLDAIYDTALGAVAQGATWTETRDALGDAYGTRATVADIEREMTNAYRDALSVGVEADDVDASWKGARQCA